MAIDQDEVKSKDEMSARLQNEERYRTILENMQEGYYEVDLAGNHTFFNNALCRILRFSPEELQGRSYRSYMDDETSLGVYKAFNKVYRTGEPLSSFEYEITRGDGEPASIELSCALMRDEDGEPCGFQGVIRDNTERKRAEEQLKQTYEELEERVEERTAELASANELLQEQIAERKKIEEALEKRNSLLETLNLLSREASIQQDFDKILHRCVKVVVEAFDVTSAYISAWDLDVGTSTVVAEFIGPQASKKERVSDKGVVYSIEEDYGKLAETIQNIKDEPYIIHLSDPDLPPHVRAHFEEYGNKTELGIPLVAQGRVIGLLEIWNSQDERTFSDEEIKTAQQIARQIATIFNNNRLYQQAQQEIAERKQAEEILKTLNEIAAETYSTLDLTTIFQRVVEFTGRLMDATSAYISTVDMDSRTIEVVAEYFGPDATEAEKLSDLGEIYSMETDFSSSVKLIDAGEDYYINHLDDKRLMESEKAHMIEYGAKSIINFMMKAKDKPIAVLEFWDSRQKREFTEEEIGLIRAFTNQVSRAVENVELFQEATKELQERRQTEKALRESQEVFRVLTESAQATIYLCHNEPGFPMIYLNDAIETLTGYPKEEFLEKDLTISSLFHPDDTIVPEDEKVLVEERSFRVTYRIKHRSGEWRWIEDMGAGVLDSDGNLMYLAGFMYDITERKQLEDQVRDSLERRSREVRLSAQVAREVASAVDLNDLYRRIVTQVKEQFDFYHVQLLRFDPLLDSVSLIAGYGQVGQKMVAEGHQMPMGVGLIGSAAATGVSYLQPDVTEDPNWQPNPLLPDTKGELAVPIKLGNEVLGVLDIQSDEVNSLTEEAQLALEGLCGQLAVAIESTRLRQEMNDRLKELNKLQQLMSREGWRSFQAQHEEDNKGYFYDQASIHPLSFNDSGGGNGRVEEPSLDVFKTNEFRKLVTSPLTVRGEAIGTLAIQDEENQPLTTEDRDLLESISVQVAEALESARLLEQTQKNAVDMETVAQVGAAASTILETQELLQTVVDLTQERFGLYFVSVFAMNEEQDGLDWVAGTQLPIALEEPIGPPTLELNRKQSLVAAAGRTRKPVVVNDVSKEPGFLPVEALPDTLSEMVIPLIVGDELLGVLDLQSDILDRFGEDDVRIQMALAAQVAVAWKNALLYAEQLETAKRLREVDRLKSEFMASMSHELRTPLNSIIGFSDVLLEGIDGALNKRMAEDVTLIRDSGRHLRELISEILDMSKIEAGMMDLRYDVVDVPQVAKEIVGNTRPLAYAKEIDVKLDLDPKLDKIEVDRTRLIQILLNLMGNAIKFTSKGTVSLIIKDKGEDIYFAVEDTGIGIHEEDIPIIFEQFRQIDASLTRKAGGTGLGMPISKSLVELHGGKMEVQSELDVGSVFSFIIPKKRPVSSKSQTGPLPVLNEVKS